MAIHTYRLNEAGKGAQMVPGNQDTDEPLYNANTYAIINGMEYKIVRVLRNFDSGVLVFIYRVELAEDIEDNKRQILTAMKILQKVLK